MTKVLLDLRLITTRMKGLLNLGRIKDMGGTGERKPTSLASIGEMPTRTPWVLGCL